jgi:hypothetical protein
VDTYVKNFRGGLNYLEGHYLQSLSYLKKAVGGTILSKTQGMISLLFAVLRVMSFFLTFSLLIKLPSYVLYTYYIMSVKLYY